MSNYRRLTFVFVTILLMGAELVADPLAFQVSIDTSSLIGSDGYLDLQFNPGAVPVDSAEAVITDLSTTGALIASQFDGMSGDVTGSLPGPETFVNDTAFNDDFEGISFGNNITFDVAFSGAALTNPNPLIFSATDFSVGVYDSTGSVPQLTNDPTGAAALAQIGPDGAFTFVGLPNANGGPSVVTITPLVTSATPEPASLLLVFLAVIIWIAMKARKGAFRFARLFVPTVLVIVLLHGSDAFAATRPKAYVSVPKSPNAEPPGGPAGCPNQSGILQVVSVPVANTVALEILVSVPAPYPITFQISSSNTSIVGGSQNQGYIPEVTLAEGATESSTFTIYGQQVGEATLTAIDTSGFYAPLNVPVTSWDLNAGDSVNKLIDANPPANPCRDNGSGNITTNPALLATCGQSAKGVATDGVTNLLMRLSAALPGTACYAISSTASLDQGSIGTAVTNTQNAGGFQEAFSLYTAPMNYGDSSGSRNIQFTFYYTPAKSLGNGNTSQFTATIPAVRPPVLLLHGLWSSSNAWPNFFQKNDVSHWTYVADYSSTNASSFSVNSPQVQNWVTQTLNKARASGIAVTQVDVIAHSMGGNLTRLYVSSSSFIRPDNLNKGDARRLVTLDTPHAGASFANLIVGLHNAVPLATEKTVASVTGGVVTQGAVCDLSENSQALQGLNSSTMIYGQVVTATGGPPGSASQPALYWTGLAGIRSFEKALTQQECVKPGFLPFTCDQYAYVFPQPTVNGFRFTQANDIVVPLVSQQGGIGSGTNFPDLIHSGFRLFGINLVSSVNNSSDVANQVYPLLDNSNSSFVSAYPGVSSSGNGMPSTVPGRGNGLDVQDWAAQCLPGKPMKPAAAAPRESARPRQPPSTLVQITSPAAGHSFNPGQTITVNVTIDPSLNATGGTLYTTGLDLYPATGFTATGYTVSIPVPAFFTGPLVLSPAIFDSTSAVTFGPDVTVGIIPATPPTSVILTEHNYYLSPTDLGQSLSLAGNFASGIQLDLTSSVTGTTYVSTNPSVVTVDAQGNFSLVGPGIAGITATNSGLSDYATFVIQNPASPLAPIDVTSSATITSSGFILNRQTGFFTGTITLKNLSTVPGPLYLILNGLTTGVSLVNGNGIAKTVSPGSPYFTLTLPGQGLVFAPGETVTIPVEFLNPTRSSIKFTPSLVRSTQTP